MAADPGLPPEPGPPGPKSGLEPGHRARPAEPGFGAMLRTSLVLCVATALLALVAFGVYQLYRWLV